MSSSPDDDVRRTWTFLTNHAHALACIARDPGTRIQDIADNVGITLRAAQNIVGDLVEAGYTTRTRVGRRNRYEVRPNLPLRHPLDHNLQIGDLLAILGEGSQRSPGRQRARATR